MRSIRSGRAGCSCSDSIASAGSGADVTAAGRALAVGPGAAAPGSGPRPEVTAVTAWDRRLVVLGLSTARPLALARYR